MQSLRQSAILWLIYNPQEIGSCHENPDMNGLTEGQYEVCGWPQDQGGSSNELMIIGIQNLAQIRFCSWVTRSSSQFLQGARR